MRTVPFRGPADLAAAVGLAAEVRDRGGVALVPTETFYGLAANPEEAAAVERVRALKGRPPQLALPVLCADWDQVETLVVVGERWREPLERLWPGPMTAILPARRPTPAGVGTTLAVRIPGLPLLCELLAAVGPLTGTSANRHGRPACVEVAAALASLVDRPDAVLDGGPTPGGQATTLVDLSGSEARVLRLGSCRWEGPLSTSQNMVAI